MAQSSNQSTSSSEESIPYNPAPNVDFEPSEIKIKPNNPVTTLYPEHDNVEYFECVSDFISQLRIFLPKEPSKRSVFHLSGSYLWHKSWNAEKVWLKRNILSPKRRHQSLSLLLKRLMKNPKALPLPADNEPSAEETPTPETTKGDNAEASTTGDYMEDFTPLIPKLDADEVAKEWGFDEDTPIDIDESDEEHMDAEVANKDDKQTESALTSPSKNQIKELTNQVLILQSQMLKLIGDALSTAASTSTSTGGQPAGVVGQSSTEGEKTTTAENIAAYPLTTHSTPHPSKPFTNTSPAQSKGKPSKVSKVEKGKDLLQHIESDSTSHISTCGPKAESKVIKRLIRLGHLTPEELAQQQILADEGKKAVEEAKKDKARKELYKDLVFRRIDAAHENLKKMGKVLNIQPGVPLSESDPVLELNRLTKTKIKNLGDLFRTTKKFKSSVYIDDLKELNNEMLYTDIFFRDARTFSLCLLMEVESRNMHPNVQMRCMYVRRSFSRIGDALSTVASTGGQPAGVGQSSTEVEKTTTAEKSKIAQLFKNHNKKKVELPKKTSPYPQQPPLSKPTSLYPQPPPPSKPFTFTSLFTNTSPAQSKGKPSKVEKGKDPLQHIYGLTTSGESIESDSTSHISTCGPKAESKVIKRLIRLGHLTPEELAQHHILADEGKKGC
ncbi:hypothetical protein Tco_1345055 [Tanacetum coccineum]